MVKPRLDAAVNLTALLGNCWVAQPLRLWRHRPLCAIKACGFGNRLRPCGVTCNALREWLVGKPPNSLRALKPQSDSLPAVRATEFS